MYLPENLASISCQMFIMMLKSENVTADSQDISEEKSLAVVIWH